MEPGFGLAPLCESAPAVGSEPVQEKPGHGHLWAGPIPLGSSRLSGTGWDFGGARAALCTLTELSESSGGTCRHQRDPCRGGDPSEQPGSPRSGVAEGFVALLYGTHAPCADPRAPAPTAAPWPPSSEPGGTWLCTLLGNVPPFTRKRRGDAASLVLGTCKNLQGGAGPGSGRATGSAPLPRARRPGSSPMLTRTKRHL